MKLLIWLLVFLPFSAHAKTFKNAYISFELPDTWECKLDHTEWICRSIQEKESKEAIIILTAKEKGPTDEFNLYKSHLSTPQTPAIKGGGGNLSKIEYVPKEVKINGQDWIDGLHLSSEIPNYFTRYMATIKEKIAVLVTFSAHRDHYANYSREFFKAIDSMRIIAAPNLINSGGPVLPGQEGSILGSQSFPEDMSSGGMEMAPEAGAGQKSGKTKLVLLLIALILAGIGIYIFMKTKKQP